MPDISSLNPTSLKAVQAENLSIEQENLVKDMALEDTLAAIQTIGPINIPPNQLLNKKQAAAEKVKIRLKSNKESGNEPDADIQNVEITSTDQHETNSDSKDNEQQKPSQDDINSLYDKIKTKTTSHTIAKDIAKLAEADPDNITYTLTSLTEKAAKAEDKQKTQQLSVVIKYYDTASSLIQNNATEFKSLGTPETLSDLYIQTIVLQKTPLEIHSLLAERFPEQQTAAKATNFLLKIAAAHLSTIHLETKELRHLLNNLQQVRASFSLRNIIQQETAAYKNTLPVPLEQATGSMALIISDILHKTPITTTYIKDRVISVSGINNEFRDAIIGILQKVVKQTPANLFNMPLARTKNRKASIQQTLKAAASHFDELNANLVLYELGALLQTFPGQENELVTSPTKLFAAQHKAQSIAKQIPAETLSINLRSFAANNAAKSPNAAQSVLSLFKKT